MVAIQASHTVSLASPSNSSSGTVFSGNGTSTSANSTSTSHNATTTTSVLPHYIAPTSSPTASSSGASLPTTSKLGAGLGAALGFAAVVILLVLWHIFKGHRQRQRQRWLQEEYANGDDERGNGGGAHVDGDERQKQQQEPAGASSSSTLSSGILSPCPGKGKQKEAVVTTSLLTTGGAHRNVTTPPPEMREISVNRQNETRSPRRGRGRGRGGRPLGGSRWERRDGHGRTDSPNAKGIAPATADRPKFSFEGVAQSEDSIEKLSQIRSNKSQADGMRERNGEQEDVGPDPEKGERARHVYEMEPY